MYGFIVRLSELIYSIFHRLFPKNYVLGKKSVLHFSADITNMTRKKGGIVIGNHTHIRGQLYIFPYGGRIEIGDYCYVGEGTRIWSSKNVKIGDRVLISHNCNLFDNITHPLNATKRHAQFKTIISIGHPKIDLCEKEIIINDDVLIASNVFVSRGVTIGRGAVIAAGSVVTKDVQPFTLVGGNPARFIKNIDKNE